MLKRQHTAALCFGAKIGVRELHCHSKLSRIFELFPRTRADPVPTEPDHSQGKSQAGDVDKPPLKVPVGDEKAIGAPDEDGRPDEECEPAKYEPGETFHTGERKITRVA